MTLRGTHAQSGSRPPGMPPTSGRLANGGGWRIAPREGPRGRRGQPEKAHGEAASGLHARRAVLVVFRGAHVSSKVLEASKAPARALVRARALWDVSHEGGVKQSACMVMVYACSTLINA